MYEAEHIVQVGRLYNLEISHERLSAYVRLLTGFLSDLDYVWKT